MMKAVSMRGLRTAAGDVLSVILFFFRGGEECWRRCRADLRLDCEALLSV